MTDKELEEKNRFTEEEYKKKVKEQFNQMLEDIEYLETQAKLESINACAKYAYFLEYSDDSRKTYDLIM